MTRRHMEAAAEIVKAHEKIHHHEAIVMADGFAWLFQRFNPLFRRDRFLAACGLDASTKPREWGGA